jgi:hypothetical protein
MAAGMKSFFLALAWIVGWVFICLFPACKGYDSSFSVIIQDRAGRVNAGLTIRPAPNDK